MAFENRKSPEAPCKCCGGSARLFGVRDFNKSCEEMRGTYLPLFGAAVYYYRCGECGFIFSTDFDDWRKEDFKRHVYNDEYVTVDPDYISVRPESNARLVEKLFGAHRERLRVLDYGGGNGVLETRLSTRGFTSVTTYDPFHESSAGAPAEGSYHLITAFEVAEHSPDPAKTFKEIAALMDADASLLLFSTLLQPADMEKHGVNWWYIGPRNGHISIYTGKSLVALLANFGLQFASANPSLHMAFRAVPPFASHLFRRS